jgi:hypothetical protein
MDPGTDPDLSRDFTLIAQLEPGRTVVAATDIEASGAALGAAISHCEWQDIHRAVLLTKPGTRSDVYLEASLGPYWYGLLEHNRISGSRYEETDSHRLRHRDVYAPAQLPAVVSARFDQRVQHLANNGWRSVEVQVARTVAGAIEHRERYATAASAEAVAALLDTLPRSDASEVIGLRIRQPVPTGEPVEDALWRWNMAWTAEHFGLAGASDQRKSVEHRLRSLDPDLVREYHRRAAVGPGHVAMAAACAQRLPPEDHAVGGLERLLDYRVAKLWEQTDARAALDSYDRIHAVEMDRGIFLGRTEVTLPDPAAALPAIEGSVARLRPHLETAPARQSRPVTAATRRAPGDRRAGLPRSNGRGR